MSWSRIDRSNKLVGVSLVVFKHAESLAWWLRLRRQLARTNFVKKLVQQVSETGKSGFFYPNEQHAFERELERIRGMTRDGYIGR
jgi:hypothetical protein